MYTFFRVLRIYVRMYARTPVGLVAPTLLSDVAIIRAIVTYRRHATHKRPTHRGIINDNVVMIPRGKEKEKERETEREREECQPVDRMASRSLARSVAGGWWREFPNGSLLLVLPGLGRALCLLARVLFYYVFQSSVGQLTIITSDVPRPLSDWRVEM